MPGRLRSPFAPVAAVVAACAAGAAAPAQSRTVVPAACATLPGNAALSMPLRWSHGVMQVCIDATLLPQGFVGRTITGLRLRRPAFFGEPPYAALQRTLTVRGGFHPLRANQLGIGLAQNRPPALAVLFGPAPVPVPATAPVGPGAAVGDEVAFVQFTTPLPVTAGSLFLEFESGDAPLQVSADHWVDAVWFENGVETGYAVPLGARTCTSRSEPLELRWTDAAGPRAGAPAQLRLSGAPPSSAAPPGFALAWFGLDPEPRAAAGFYPGFGGSLAAFDPALAGCHVWAPLDVVFFGATDAAGGYPVSFPLPPGIATPQLRIGVQGGYLDLSRPTLPVSVSNGVMLVVGGIEVGSRCVTIFFPGAATTSPWLPYLGQMPVLVLEH
jgi:hypothetical protein